jgi:hypothetical protein
MGMIAKVKKGSFPQKHFAFKMSFEKKNYKETPLYLSVFLRVNFVSHLFRDREHVNECLTRNLQMSDYYVNVSLTFSPTVDALI